MSPSPRIRREFRYQARAAQGEEVTLWAAEVDGRYVPLSKLPVATARLSTPATAAQTEAPNPPLVVRDGEPHDTAAMDRCRPGQLWERRVVVSAPLGTRFRQRKVFTARGHKLNSCADYLLAGAIDPIRRYRDRILVLWHGGRLLSEPRYAELCNRRRGARAPANAQHTDARSAADNLLKTLG